MSKVRNIPMNKKEAVKMDSPADVVPFWAGYYLGIPYVSNGRDIESNDLDDWGLVRTVYAQMTGIAVPSWVKETHYEKLNQLTKSNYWRMVARQNAQVYDIIAFRWKPVTISFGIVLGGGKMLYLPRYGESTIVDYTKGDWSANIVGLHRYKSFFEQFEDENRPF